MNSNVLAVQLNGTYTINPSATATTANFQNFTSAITFLTSTNTRTDGGPSNTGTLGVSGRVIFNVYAATYTECLDIPAITGSNRNNSVTFQSLVNNPDSVIIAGAPGGATSNFVVRLSNASYLRFKSLTFQSIGSTAYGIVFFLTNSSSNDSIHNCKLIGKTTTSTSLDFVVFQTAGITRHDSISLTNSKIYNGSEGIYLRSNSSSNLCIAPFVSGNSFLNQYCNGASFEDCSGLKFINNLISNNTYYTTFTATFFYSCGYGLVVSKNIIQIYYGGDGIVLNYCTGTSAVHTIVSNNVIMINSGYTGSIGIVGSDGTWEYILNNSIYIYGSTPTTSSGASLSYLSGYNNNVFQNNSIYNTTSGYAISMFNPSLGCVVSDYNNLYTNGSTFGTINTPSSSPATFSAWKATALTDLNSVSLPPGYTSTSNLQPNPSDPNSWSLNGRGIQNAQDTDDILGNPRSVTLANGAPDIGAYEFTPVTLPPLALASPSTPAAGTTQTFTFAGDTVAKISWAVASTVPSAISVRLYSGTNPPTINIGRYMNTYWDISAPAGSYNYTLNLYFKSPWLGTNPNETGLRLAKYNTSWSPFTGSTSSVDTVRNIITASGITTTAIFTGTNNNNPLPVELIELSVNKSKDDVIINWSTASEQNSSWFEIERSLDGKNFSSVGNVKAGGYSRTYLSYVFTDYNIFKPGNTGIIYYRLKIVDKDGSFDYSKTVSVNSNNEMDESITVYPNPFTNTVFTKINSTTATSVVVELKDITGKMILSKQQIIDKGLTQIQLENWDELQQGIYFVLIKTETMSTKIKLIKE
ncbi:MAG: T9SS type A sorting domain-containing protein [Bacteroidia bacterium]